MLQVLPPCSSHEARPSFKPHICVNVLGVTFVKGYNVRGAVTLTQLLCCNLVACLYTKKKPKFHFPVVEWCSTYIDS